jgi:biotin carboxylase
VEVNARLGGDLIPHLVHLATGVDLAAAAIDVAAGRPLQLNPTRRAAASIRFLYPRVDMRVRTLGVGAALGDLRWVERLVWTAQPGDELRLPPGGFMSRLGFVVVTGANADECRTRQAEVEGLTEVEFEPLVVADDSSGIQTVGGQTRR